MKQSLTADKPGIYESLKDRIILLDYEPGHLIREKDLMEEFQVSRTPVREALIRLQSDELVRMVPSSGTFVTEVSFVQLRDTFEVRTHLIPMAGKLAALRITQDELLRLEELIQILKNETDTKAIMRLDLEIHSLVDHATRNSVLAKILGNLRNQTVRIWSLAPKGHEYFRHIVADFEELHEALQKRDPEKAARTLEKHFSKFVDFVQGTSR
ncbi:MAG: FCD domain-containing protein [Gammaproteobacteria bacterium]|jgi:DNA-binding GntR family transcriptional regulator|nr:FCD domain-containing protein [Gammaproteobacteria bacterium]